MKVTPIRARRIKMGLGVDEALEKLKIGKSIFYKLEQGHRTPSVRLIVRMARLYQCTTDEIFEDFNITD